jgi:hypothetical protein
VGLLAEEIVKDDPGQEAVLDRLLDLLLIAVISIARPFAPSAEWIDTSTGEIARGRVVPADRRGGQRFLGRLAGQELEVALEATTGWRLVAEELRRAGARVHLAETAETSGLRGPKKRAKTDWTDARHPRELLMIERLPESWIPPDHILDLRARVRLWHTLSHQRGEWQQRIQAVLYHHGFPHKRDLMTADRTAPGSAPAPQAPPGCSARARPREPRCPRRSRPHRSHGERPDRTLARPTWSKPCTPPPTSCRAAGEPTGQRHRPIRARTTIQASRRGGRTKGPGSKPIAQTGLPADVLPNKPPSRIARPYGRTQTEPPTSIFMPRNGGVPIGSSRPRQMGAGRPHAAVGSGRDRW